MTHKLVQMLTEKSLCNGGIEEKLCYDVGQELFGFDSSNINMVLLSQFLFTCHYSTLSSGIYAKEYPTSRLLISLYIRAF